MENEQVGADIEGTPLYSGTRIIYARHSGRNAARLVRATVVRAGAPDGCRGCYGKQHLMVLNLDPRARRPVLLHYGEECLAYDWDAALRKATELARGVPGWGKHGER